MTDVKHKITVVGKIKIRNLKQISIEQRFKLANE